ncbi:hypothetical protein VA7868_03580 [Vibrio aerogenes CECT 7868]|uniref:Uncharacterized protein n=1 Tax=Vibrio aerogenes CECT 7868 TaxID=1216006 RepID=A0A1M6AI01_9VIBR|nr:hypothetical protein VA7868_03580 [Vibrio aerogenes CECT 7868]
MNLSGFVRMDALTKPFRPAPTKRIFWILFHPGKSLWGASTKSRLDQQHLIAHQTIHKSQNLPNQNHNKQRKRQFQIRYVFQRGSVGTRRGAASTKRHFRIRFSPAKSIWGAPTKRRLDQQNSIAHQTIHKSQNLPNQNHNKKRKRQFQTRYVFQRRSVGTRSMGSAQR